MAKERIPEIRKPYYEAQDAMYQMRGVLSEHTPTDIELRKLLHKVQDALYEFETELTKRYIWD